MRGTSSDSEIDTPKMGLTDTAVRNAKPRSKPRKMADEKGLFLLIHSNGSKYWRLNIASVARRSCSPWAYIPRCRLLKPGNAGTMLASCWPTMLTQAYLSKKRSGRAGRWGSNSFEAVGREWYAKHSPNWAPSHGDKVIRRLERDIFPWIGTLPIADVTPYILLTALRRIESRGALETAHRAHQNCSQIFRYAIATGRAERDPAVDLRGALPPSREKHHQDISDPTAIGELMRRSRLSGLIR